MHVLVYQTTACIRVSSTRSADSRWRFVVYVARGAETLGNVELGDGSTRPSFVRDSAKRGFSR